MQHTGHGLAQCGGLQVHLTAFGHDHAVFVVGHDSVDARGGQLQFDFSGSPHRRGHCFGSTQSHAALGCDDLTFVAHMCAQQGHIATGGHTDAALVDHLACAAVAGVARVARHEVGVGDLEGGGREGAGTHAAIAAHHDALGVDQHHLAIGLQLPQNLGGVV